MSFNTEYGEIVVRKTPMEAIPKQKWVSMKETVERLCLIWMEENGVLQEFTCIMQEFRGMMESDQIKDVYVREEFK
jgi:hypothetical protein